MSWKNDSLDRLFSPKSIAVIGASDKPEKLGALTLLALDTFQGKVYPVNPRLKTIGQKKCYASLRDIEDRVDMAMIAVGPQHVIPAMSECQRRHLLLRRLRSPPRGRLSGRPGHDNRSRSGCECGCVDGWGVA